MDHAWKMKTCPPRPPRRIAIQPYHVLTIALVHLLDFGRRVGDGLAVLVEQAEPRHLTAWDPADLVLTLEEDEVGRRDRDLHPTRFRMTIGTLQEHVTGREELARVEAAQRLIAPSNDGFAFGKSSALLPEGRPVDVLQGIENELEAVCVEQTSDGSAIVPVSHLATITSNTSPSQIPVIEFIVHDPRRLAIPARRPFAQAQAGHGSARTGGERAHCFTSVIGPPPQRSPIASFVNEKPTRSFRRYTA